MRLIGERAHDPMSQRGNLFLVGCLPAGLLVIVLLVYAVAPKARPQAPRPPELGGQQVPNSVFDIRFDKRYDLFCSFFGEEPTIYHGCKILGFTGRGEESTRSAPSGGGVFSGPSGSGSYGSDSSYFEHWLVIELKDGRRAYIPPTSVKYIEEASNKVE